MALGRDYRRLQEAHRREPPESARRRRLTAEMSGIRARFERLCDRWLDDPRLAEAWRRHLQEGGPPPETPRLPRPPEFVGRTESGARVEVFGREDGGHDLVVGGKLERHEATPWSLPPDASEPVWVGGHACGEVFDAPEAALAALAALRDAPEAEPPWRFARALRADGLIDESFALTPRGRRALRGRVSDEPAPPQTTQGVLVANAGLARLLVLERPREAQAAVQPLTEVAHWPNREGRARDGDLLSETRPGLRQASAQGPRHGVSDRRERRRRHLEQRFAERIAEAAARAWRDWTVDQATVVASSAMLGLLRAAFAKMDKNGAPWSLQEVPRDLTRLPAPRIHDALAAEGVLPPRGRRALLDRP
jgi:protein required for attachment to host cells